MRICPINTANLNTANLNTAFLVFDLSLKYSINGFQTFAILDPQFSIFMKLFNVCGDSTNLIVYKMLKDSYIKNIYIF